MASKQAGAGVRLFSARKFSKLIKGTSSWIFSAQVRQATGVEINPMSIENYRKGKSVPGFNYASAIAKTLGVTLDELGE